MTNLYANLRSSMKDVRWIILGSFLVKGRGRSEFIMGRCKCATHVCALMALRSCRPRGVDPRGAKRQKRKDAKAKNIQMKKEADGINQLRTQLGGDYNEDQT